MFSNHNNQSIKTMLLLENKVAYISGGGSGIGEAIAKAYAKEGAKVVVSDINSDHGQAVVDSIKKDGGEAIFIKADSSSAEENKRVVEEIVKAYGKLDVACNNAGIGGPAALTGEYDVNAWDKVIGLNLNGVFYACRYQLEQMVKNGGGSIINIASIHGTVAAPMSPAYTASKHGVVGLTKNIAAEYGQLGVRCNAVGPGYIATPLLDNNLTDDMKKMIAGKSSMNRLGTPEEIADLVVFLASDKSSFTTGSYFIADGGYTAV
ncbi:NAD(P)-dependent dehydrogenase (short-subunit alcohol dehydrogenase family) [Algoriphagus zhangzhouensis]|uniref:NAD(P)-dependent dehydrogenase, short-chain alcohol dehydrogenase family n=2 Tax=Algoriphagus zhangzhouensis TaxID=1073327 RepID=A0A1M7ZDL7_9BACT|nr:NAD(P)-dependent dehydrogenase (short-subunit alcohol dehydrogenase family) [Algoriphagus zhangzhouensis]SHO62964.1 NAD(P)-dependent dehydrogenase, short-chain alcohol dehydrogenase family [Algoriphagus zhangzhouensis]